MDHEKLKKLAGFDITERLNSTQKMLEAASGVNHLSKLNKFYEKSMQGFNSTNLAAIMESKRPKSAWEYLTSPQSNMLAYDAIQQQANRDLMPNIVLGGSTITTLAKFIQESGNTAKKINSALTGIQSLISSNEIAYNAHLATSKSLANYFAAETKLSNPGIFSASNYLENKKLNPFDVLSGVSFSNIAKVYELSGKSETLAEEFKAVEDDFNRNVDLKHNAGEFINAVASVKDDYVKLDDIITNWIYQLTSTYGWTKQRAYNLAILLIFIVSVYHKELLIAPFKSDNPANNITVNVSNNYSIESKSENIDNVIKDAPVFSSIVNGTKKIGKMKANTEVKIINMKEGWCFVEGVFEITKKRGKQLIKSDTTDQVWIKQHFLKKFQ